LFVSLICIQGTGAVLSVILAFRRLTLTITVSLVGRFSVHSICCSSNFVWCGRFYVGCNVCLEWFHGTCVGISANDVRNLSSYVCHSCRSSCTETETAELHCICQTPYDESKYDLPL